VALLAQETPRFIGPDLNPVDYKIWGLMQERVYKSPIKDVGDLQRQLVEAQAAVQQSGIDDATGEWRQRLRFCVSANGGYFVNTFCEFRF
jgi:hypothetical protein